MKSMKFGWQRTAQVAVMAVSASLGLGMSNPAHALDLVNGSLSGPPTNGGVPAGWRTVRDSPDTNDVNNNTGMPYYLFVTSPSPSPDGGTWVGLGVAPASNFFERFGQTVSGFAVGSSYTVSWYASNFGFASFSGPAGNLDDPARIQLWVDGNSVGQGSTLAQQPGWVAQSLTFTATAGTHELVFGAATLGISSYVGIDGISVALAPVPEPAGAALLLLGLCGLAAVARRSSAALP